MKSIAIALLLLSWSALSGAAPLPWRSTVYSHYSDHEPLSDVLRSLVAGEGISVVVSPRITEVVSLHVQREPPQQVLERLAGLYHLTWYFDGQVLYVYRDDELQTATLKLRRVSPADFTRMLRRVGVFEARFPWRVAERERLVYFAGPRPYVALVMEMAKALERGRGRRAGAVVYRWTDAAGVVNFGSAPPEGHPYDVIDLATGGLVARQVASRTVPDFYPPAAGAGGAQ